MNIISCCNFLAHDPRERENPTRIVTASGDVLDGVERRDIYGIFPSMLDAFRDHCNFHAEGIRKLLDVMIPTRWTMLDSTIVQFSQFTLKVRLYKLIN